MAVAAAKLEIGSVADASGLETSSPKGRTADNGGIAVIGKTDGDGGVDGLATVLDAGE